MVNKLTKQISGTTIVNTLLGIIVRTSFFLTFQKLSLTDDFNIGHNTEWVPVSWNILVKSKTNKQTKPTRVKRAVAEHHW